jgi:endonuclease-8
VIDRATMEIEPRTLRSDVPEGDTIHYAANRIRSVLAGYVPDAVATPHPRFARAGWPERLAGRAVTAVDAHGKHLFLRFEGGLTIHSHLRMTGAWRVLEGRRAPRSAWLAIRRGEREVVQLNGPVLELMTESRTRFDQRLAGLGPDILAPEFDEARFLRRLRDDDPTRPIGDALLDQRTIAGIGNLWKVEGCFEARIDPWRPAGKVSDEEALAIVAACRPRMQQSALDGKQDRHRRIYARAGRPCPRCGTPIEARGQWEDNRTTFWCPACQA